MKKRKGMVSETVIRKVHDLLTDVETGEEILDFFRATEPVFMQEVSRFVQHEQDKISEDFSDDEDLLMYIGSLSGAAYVMGFLIAREQFHNMYKGLLDLDSVVKEVERSEVINSKKTEKDKRRKKYHCEGYLKELEEGYLDS